jgi:hypothetical protein
VLAQRRFNFVKPKAGEVWRDGPNGPLVEVVATGLRYATVKVPDGSSRFTRMVRFQDLLSVRADEIPTPPPTPVTEEELDAEFLEDE